MRFEHEHDYHLLAYKLTAMMMAYNSHWWSLLPCKLFMNDPTYFMLLVLINCVLTISRALGTETTNRIFVTSLPLLRPINFCYPYLLLATHSCLCHLYFLPGMYKWLTVRIILISGIVIKLRSSVTGMPTYAIYTVWLQVQVPVQCLLTSLWLHHVLYDSFFQMLQSEM